MHIILIFSKVTFSIILTTCICDHHEDAKQFFSVSLITPTIFYSIVYDSSIKHTLYGYPVITMKSSKPFNIADAFSPIVYKFIEETGRF